MSEEKEYSKNKEAEAIVGVRPDGIAIDQPVELGYVCPVCKNANEFGERGDKGAEKCPICCLPINKCECEPYDEEN